MAEQAHVQLSGDISGRYVVTDQRAGGELTLVPDTSWEAILERSGGREMTPEESAEFWAEHEPSHAAAQRRAVGHCRQPDGAASPRTSIKVPGPKT